MHELTISQPYPDPTQARKMRPDWLVVTRAGDRVDVHRFKDRDDADVWLDERLADPAQERELDERRLEL